MARKFKKAEDFEEKIKTQIKKDVEIIPNPEPDKIDEPDLTSFDESSEDEFRPEPEKITVNIKEEDVKDLDEKFSIDAEDEIKKLFHEEEKIVEVKVDSLSPAQLRAYQRSGILRK